MSKLFMKGYCEKPWWSFWNKKFATLGYKWTTRGKWNE